MPAPRLCEQLLIVLARDIVNGRWTADESLPTTRQLARELGVSQPTAMKLTRLLARHGLVQIHAGRSATVAPEAAKRAADLLRRREAAAPLPTVSRPADGPARVALLVPEVDWPLTSPALVSLHDHLRRIENQAGLHFEAVAWPVAGQQRVALSLPAKGYAAAVCLSLRGVYLAGVATLQQHDYPVLVVNRQFEIPGLATVTSDDYRPVREVATRLIRMGHRNMSMVADLLPTTQSNVHEAIRGWLDALDGAGILQECPMPVYIMPDVPLLRESRCVFEALLCRPDRPTALFFYWPVWADVILRDPRFADLRVPEDVSLVLGMPGERFAIPPGCPPLCTLDFDYRRYAECIVEAVRDMLQGQRLAKRLTVPLKWNSAESIGPPPLEVRVPDAAGSVA
ncbi:MAG TPA: GntR family transcriptional regulator [Phycisphaerae bacterium]|nr:GntR family transcriptional regulator [Phycisphaerae bacterium]